MYMDSPKTAILDRCPGHCAKGKSRAFWENLAPDPIQLMRFILR